MENNSRDDHDSQERGASSKIPTKIQKVQVVLFQADHLASHSVSENGQDASSDQKPSSPLKSSSPSDQSATQITLPPIKSVYLLCTNKKRGQFWQNVTGGVEAGESFREAGLREVTEETGLKDIHKLYDPNKTFYYIDHKNRYVIERLYYCVTSSETLHIDEKEHSDFRLSSIEKVTPNHYGYISNHLAFEICLNNYHARLNHNKA